MFGLEILFALGVAIIAAALSALFLAIIIGIIVAVVRTVRDEKGKKK